MLKINLNRRIRINRKGVIMKNVLLFSGILATALLTYHTYGQKNQLPNIVLIMADDMGYECLSCNGSLSYSTPNIDRLASQGVRFTHCFSQPLCTPSRVKIMTGKYNYHNYKAFAYLDPKETTFGNLLKKAGYRTMVAGKWQLNGSKKWDGWDKMDRPVDSGFDEYCLWQLTHSGERYPNPYIEQNGKVLKTTIDDYGPDIVSNYILDFLQRNRNNLFFVYYPMILVHNPFRPTPDSPEWKDVSKRMDDNKKYFKDMMEYTDKIVGKIDHKLKKLGIRDNTILIFTGDNGTHNNITTETIYGIVHGGKGKTTDTGTHVPLIINWPDEIKEEIVTDNLVDFSDFLPTMTEAAKAGIPKDIDGKSFLSFLKNEKYKPRETVLVHYDAKLPVAVPESWKAGRFVRNKKYKLYHDNKFYNLEIDKDENNPLKIEMLSPAEKRIYKKLKKIQNSAPVWVGID